MICKHCGTEIAAKALICYRCGQATAEPRVKTARRGLNLRQAASLETAVAAGVAGARRADPPLGSCSSSSDVTSGFWLGVAAYSIWGLFPIYWKLRGQRAGRTGAGAPHRVVVRGAWRAVAWPGRQRMSRGTITPTSGCAMLCSSPPRSIGVNWALLRMGGGPRLRGGNQPRLLHHAARQRPAGCGGAARTSALVDVGGGGACGGGRRRADPRPWRAAPHRARPGRELRDLRPGEEDGAAAAARRPGARDGAAGACRRRLYLVAAERSGDRRVPPRTPRPPTCS